MESDLKIPARLITISLFTRKGNSSITDVPELGVPLQIICIANKEEDGKIIHELELNKENLEKIMLHPEVKDRPIVIVSIAGAFRKGKSFLLGFILKYLETQPHVCINTMLNVSCTSEMFMYILSSL